MAHLSGELIHLVKCIPVEVEIRNNLENCYNELPVIYNDNEMFLSHKSKILIRHGTERICNRLLPIGFKIGGIWITFTPKLEVMKNPEMLSPDVSNVWVPEEIKNLASGGFYSEAEMKDYLHQILFPIDRKAILDNTAAIIAKTEEDEKTSPGISYNIFTTGFWKMISMKYWKNFQDFGIVSAGLLGTFVTVYIIIHLINVIIRCFTLHKIFGFSFKILAALLSSLTHCVLVLGNSENFEIRKELKSTHNEEIELKNIKIIPSRVKSKIPIRKQKLNPSTSNYATSIYSIKSSMESCSENFPVPAPRHSLNNILQEKHENLSKEKINMLEIKRPWEYNHYSC